MSEVAENHTAGSQGPLTRVWRWLTGAEQRETTERAIEAIDVIKVEWPATAVRLHELERRVREIEDAMKSSHSPEASS